MSEEDNEEYICLINEEEQYSIWFAWKEVPIGWKQVGPKGTKQEVLNYVKEVWTDMRPKSLREQMDKLSSNQWPSIPGQLRKVTNNKRVFPSDDSVLALDF